MNVKLLRKVAKHILAEPKRFFMDDVDFYANPGEKVVLDGIEREIPACGTAACIAGWACILSKKKRYDVGLATAQKLLRINASQAAYLFYEWSWPSEIKKRWYKAKTVGTRAKIANERIEEFIKTGE